MDYEIRPITWQEFPAYARAIGTAFGEGGTDEDMAMWREITEYPRTLAVFVAGRIVATAGAESFVLTLPGLTTTPVAGVTAVTVMPTHRRRGLLTAMMRRQLSDVRERGEAIAVLNASESVIYGRFGYGMATQSVNLEIDTRYRDFAFTREARGQVRMIERDEAQGIVPRVYDRFRQTRAGSLSRSAQWWLPRWRDPQHWRDGANERFYVIYESRPGRADGYVTYRIKEQWNQGFPAHTLTFSDLIALSPEAYSALWSYCLSVDLVGTVKAMDSPLDEPVRWMLADPRRLRTTGLYDQLWLRLVDIPAALSARRYSACGRLVLGVTDRFYPDNTGRYELEAGADGAECRPTGADPDLELEVAALGTTYLGGVRFSTLALAGRVQECRPGALAEADAMFAADPIPWCNTHF